MKRFSSYSKQMIALPLCLLLLAACGGSKAPDVVPAPGGTAKPPIAGGTPNQPAPGDTPGQTAGYEVVGSEKVAPKEAQGQNMFRLAETEQAFKDLWSTFGFTNAAPAVDFAKKAVLFVSTGESGSCPVELQALTVEESTIWVKVGLPAAFANRMCTMDYTPRSMAIAIDKTSLPSGELKAGMAKPSEEPAQVIRQK